MAAKGAKWIDGNLVDQFNSDFDELEKEGPSRKLTQKEFVNKLADRIKDLVDKGYTYERITEIFGKRGISIKVTTLRQYISAVAPRKKTARRIAKKDKADIPVAKAAEKQPNTRSIDNGPGFNNIPEPHYTPDIGAEQKLHISGERLTPEGIMRRTRDRADFSEANNSVPLMDDNI